MTRGRPNWGWCFTPSVHLHICTSSCLARDPRDWQGRLHLGLFPTLHPLTRPRGPPEGGILCKLFRFPGGEEAFREGWLIALFGGPRLQGVDVGVGDWGVGLTAVGRPGVALLRGCERGEVRWPRDDGGLKIQEPSGLPGHGELH